MNFEDLIWLFTSNEASRGIVRLNIAEGALLFKCTKKVCDGAVLEIGRKHGGSTVLIAAALNRGHLYSVDIVMHECVYKYTDPFKDKITFITIDSKKMVWKDSLDMVFIDGDHSYNGVKRDIDTFANHVVSGGFLVFHDVLGKKSVLQPLIDRLIKREWKEFDKANSMLVLQRC